VSRSSRSIAGVTYYYDLAEDGWPTGPCPSVELAVARRCAYERGEEVSEAAPGQCSRAQMTAFAAWLEDQEQYAGVMDAVVSGLHSAEWVRASALFVSVIDSLPDYIVHAGGARIRRATGEVSLARGGRP
jgi:hypothetical protein